MKTKNRSLFCHGLAFAFALVITVSMGVKSYALTYDPVIPDGQTPYVKNTDGSMIPDKYNTGVDPSIALKAYHPSDSRFEVNGLYFTGRTDLDEIQLDFAHTPNVEDGATYTVENVDFTNTVRFRFVDYQHFGDTNKKVTVIFKNSKFSSVSNEDANPNYNYEFYDCEFDDASGYNMLFVRSKFHPITGDAMDPHGHVTVRDSYMYTEAHPESGERHLDGFQTFGRAVADMEHVSFNNVRVEIVKTKAQKDNGEWFVSYVNAAAMLAVEYSANAHDVSLENMILNGGGYTIYITCSRDCRSFTNFSLKNVKVGYGHMFNMVYGYHANGIAQSDYDAAVANVEHIPTLYAGSAWKNSAGVHLSVTNDITEARVLTCVDERGAKTTHQIKAHPKITQNMPVADVPLFADLPYDLDVVVANADATSVDCYDTTDSTDLATAPLIRSIRFESSANATPSGSNSLPNSPETGDFDIIPATICGGALIVLLYGLTTAIGRKR